MQASITTIEVTTQEFHTVITQVNTHVVPTVRDLPGFNGAYWFGDRSAGLFRAVVFFETGDNVFANHELARRSTAEAQSSVSGRVPAFEEYEVEWSRQPDRISAARLSSAQLAMSRATLLAARRFAMVLSTRRPMIIPQAEHARVAAQLAPRWVPHRSCVHPL